MSPNFKIGVDIELTASVLAGILVIVTGIVSLFTIKDISFASNCVITGSGLVAAAKACNTYWDTHMEHNDITN